MRLLSTNFTWSSRRCLQDEGATRRASISVFWSIFSLNENQLPLLWLEWESARVEKHDLACDLAIRRSARHPTRPSTMPPSNTEKELRARAEMAEKLAHEESAKSAALQTLVEHLMEESASLQRKWEHVRDTPAKPPLPTRAFSSPPSANPPPQTPKPQPPSLPPSAACSGVLVLSLETLDFEAADDEEETPLFIEFWLDETLVRSHALPASTELRRAQTFARQSAWPTSRHLSLYARRSASPMVQAAVDPLPSPSSTLTYQHCRHSLPRTSRVISTHHLARFRIACHLATLDGSRPRPHDLRGVRRGAYAYPLAMSWRRTMPNSPQLVGLALLLLSLARRLDTSM